MTEPQAKQFLRDCCCALPGLGRFVDSTGDGGAALFAAWMTVLATLDLALASEVIVKLSCGDIPLGERWSWQELPQLLRRHCLRAQYRLSDEAREAARKNRDSTYACPRCRDTGFVIIYHPGFARAVINDRRLLDSVDPTGQEDIRALFDRFIAAAQRPTKKSFVYAARCTCDLGERHRESLPAVATYQPSRSPIARTGKLSDWEQWFDGDRACKDWDPNEWGEI